MLPLEPLKPFALFDDAGGPEAAPSRLLTGLSEAIAVRTPAELEPALAAVRAALARGLHVGGWLAYEAGLLFEPRPAADWDAAYRRLSQIAGWE